MDSTVTPAPPKSPQGFTLAEVEGDDARVGRLLREAAHQPDVARLDAMAGSDLGEIRPRVSRGVVRFLTVFSIGVGVSLAWHWYGDAARAMIATSWPQLASLALEPASVPRAASAQAATTQATVSPELQRLKEDLAQLKQELQQLKGMPAALASLRQSVDRLAGSQQQIAGTIAKQSTQKPASPPRPAPAPKSLTPPSASKPLTPLQAEAR
jgi:TolA-binding protein